MRLCGWRIPYTWSPNNVVNQNIVSVFNKWNNCLSDSNEIRTHNHLVRKRTFNQPNWPNDWAVLWVLICKMQLTLCYYYVMYVCETKSTLYSCLNAKKLLAQNRRDIWSLSDCNGIWTHSHLVRKGTLNHLAKLAKWLSCVVSTYLYGAFDCMFLSCHVRVLKWICTL